MGKAVLTEALQSLSICDSVEQSKDSEQTRTNNVGNGVSGSGNGRECQENENRQNSSAECSTSGATGQEYLCYFMHRLLSFR